MAIVQAEIVDLVRCGVGLGIRLSLLDPIDKSKEIIPKINRGVRHDERADVVLDEFVPSENNIDFGKRENRGKRIGWRVKDETFDRGALESW